MHNKLHLEIKTSKEHILDDMLNFFPHMPYFKNSEIKIKNTRTKLP